MMLKTRSRWVGQVLALAAVYGTAARLSLFLAFEHTNASPVWPPSGIALAAVYFFGYRIWPGVFLGAFAANYFVLADHVGSLSGCALISLLIAAGNTLETIVGVYLLRLILQARHPFHQTSDVFKFVGSVMTVCLIPSLIGPTVLSVANTISWYLFPTAFLTWWLGDVTGILMLAPFFFLWYRALPSGGRRSRQIEWRAVSEALGFVILLVAVCWGVFNAGGPFNFFNVPGSYLLISMIVLGAFRFGQKGVAWGIPIISCMAVWGTLHDSGPFVRDHLNESLLFLQIFIVVIVLTGLVLASALREKEKAQLVLRRNQQDLSDFFENATIGLHRVGPDGLIQWANKAQLAMLGLESEEYIGHHVSEFHVDQERLSGMLAVLSRGQTVENHETQLRGKNGQTRDVLMDSSALFEEGRLIYTREFIRDVTDRKQIEKILKSHEKWFRTLIENSADIITLINAQGTIIYSSPSTTRILGYQLQEYIGRNIFEFVHLEDMEVITGLFTQLLEKPGNFVSAECRYRHKSGSWLWLEGSASNMTADENIRAVVINCRDISARKRAEAALRQSEERLHGIFESSKDAIAYTSTDGVLIDINEGFVKLTGYSKDELLGKKRFIDLTPPEYHACDRAHFEQVLHTGQPQEYEKEYIAKSGLRVPVLVTIFMVRDINGQAAGLAGIVKDITERRKAEEERFRLAAIVDSSSDAIIGKNLEGIVTSWNRAAQELYGYTAKEMVGRSLSILMPEDRPSELGELLDRLKRGEDVKQFETVRIHKDGHPIAVSLTISPMKNSVGKVVGASTIGRDITERKRLVEQLQETARLKSEFTSTVSHELRTPLAISKEALSLLLREKVGPVVPKQREIMTIASSNIDRLCFLIDDILDFSKIEAGKMELHKDPCDLIPVLRESCDGWKLKADLKRIALRFVSPLHPVIASVDKIRFLQILSNLMSNAIKFTPEGGWVEVTVREEAQMIRIAVADAGPGIAQDDLPKLFQKFQQLQRTHGPGARGTGLGLSIVKSLVEMHQGDITVKSILGQGSVFIVRLPKFSTALSATNHCASPENIKKESQSIPYSDSDE